MGKQPLCQENVWNSADLINAFYHERHRWESLTWKKNKKTQPKTSPPQANLFSSSDLKIDNSEITLVFSNVKNEKIAW